MLTRYLIWPNGNTCLRPRLRKALTHRSSARLTPNESLEGVTCRGFEPGVTDQVSLRRLIPRCNNFLGSNLAGWQSFYIPRITLEHDPCGPLQSFWGLEMIVVFRNHLAPYPACNHFLGSTDGCRRWAHDSEEATAKLMGIRSRRDCRLQSQLK